VRARQTPAIEGEKFHGGTSPGVCTALSAPTMDFVIQMQCQLGHDFVPLKGGMHAHDLFYV
jgi:hypothetical protein